VRAGMRAVQREGDTVVWICVAVLRRKLTDLGVGGQVLFDPKLEPTYNHQPDTYAWASTHRDKWGQLTPLENGWKMKKRKHAKRAVF